MSRSRKRPKRPAEASPPAPSAPASPQAPPARDRPHAFAWLADLFAIVGRDMDRTQSEYERIQREVDAFESPMPETARADDAHTGSTDATEQQRTKDEQAEARRQAGFRGTERAWCKIQEERAEQRAGAGYRDADGTWVSARHGAPPDPPPTTVAPVPEPSPQISSQTQKPVDRWLFLVGVAIAILFFLLPKTPLVIIACCAALICLLAHPVWNFWWIERSRVRQVVALLALILAAAAVGKIAWPEPTQGVHNESSGNTPTAEATFRLSPVMTHHPILIEYADIDGTGRRIYVRDRLDNTTNDVITYTHYGKAILARTAHTEDDALTLLEPLKDEVRRLASGGGAVVSALEPMAENVPIYILGPHATEKEWHDFLAGRTSLYFDDLIYPKLADKRRFHLEECGIARAAKYVFEVPPCPKRGIPEDI